MALLIFYVFFHVSKLKKEITKPIESLKKGMKEIAGGNFDYKLDDELGDLCRTMNDMMNVVNDSREEAERANEAKSQFLANMSHEIRTPLNSIIGYADILADDELSFEHRTMTRSIKNNSETLLSLINDILDLAKIESGEMSLEHIAVNLEDILYEVCESQVIKFNGSQTEIHIEFNDAYALVYTDPLRIKQILMNVIGNAVKFTEKGEIVVSVDILGEDEQFIKLEFSVSDTGIGMTEDQTQVIFDAFKQADGSTTRKYGGTGLGLSISRQILAEMGGEIKVKSTTGKGSEFFFELYLEKYFPEQDETYIETSKLKSKVVLIADDNEVALKILTNYFVKTDIKFFTASSASEALKCLNFNQVDILLLDLMMPGIDGLSLAQKVQDQFPQVKKIAVTGDIRPGTMVRVKEDGFEGYLLKPIRRKILYHTLFSLYNDTVKEALLTEDKIEHKFHPRKILVVDDNNVNSKLALKVFSKMGHNAEAAASGKEALDMVEDTVYDIIFMDMQMPEMSGVEATVLMRKRGVETAIIALTANAYDSDRQACQEAGMDDFTTKPIRRDVLHDLIHKYSPGDSDYHELRLLLVEDDPEESLQTVSLIKERFPGVILKTACTGIESLTLMGSFLPHILIVDLMQPGMDGVKVMEFLNCHSNYKDVKLLVNSNLEINDDRVQKMISMGAMGAVCKRDSQKDHMLEVALKKSGLF